MKARRCYICHVRIVTERDKADPKKTFTEAVHAPHCGSPTCDYCKPCYQVMLTRVAR